MNDNTSPQIEEPSEYLITSTMKSDVESSEISADVKSSEIPAPLRRPSEEIPTEFECSICMRLLLDPVSTSCGHTFCKSCIEKALGYQSACPMCRSPCSVGFNVNILLSSIILQRYPKLVENRLKENYTQTEESHRQNIIGVGGSFAPLMISDLEVLPHSSVYMTVTNRTHIALLDFVLGGNRRFGIVKETPNPENIHIFGVCVEVFRRQIQENVTVVSLAGKHRFILTEQPEVRDAGGFLMGHFSAVFDEPIVPILRPITTDASSTMPVDDGEDSPHKKLVIAIKECYILLEKQLNNVGSSGRREFDNQMGPFRPVNESTGPSELESISFWLANSIVSTNEEKRVWIQSCDTAARVDHVYHRLLNTGSRPILNLRGSTSILHFRSASQSILLFVFLVLAFALNILYNRG
eukprot:GHVL01021021.1.p1 GENE.GHVL01021021.1~~GHVL01021021.1.p1  ORF type:complete len:410 (+),score=48.04 GHVL01021021.1:43-1272(+)